MASNLTTILRGLLNGKWFDHSPDLSLPEWHLFDSQICSTLSEWEHVTERFENATHYSEKALYKLLKNHIVPVVVADLRVGRPDGVCFLWLKQCLGN